jgi:hypothetical protein
MPQLTPNEKHNILTIYSHNQHKHSFESLAHQFDIKGGGRTIHPINFKLHFLQLIVN